MAEDWPADWDDLVKGVGCGMCTQGRPDRTEYGVLIRAGTHTDAYLQRAEVRPGYSLVIWRGRHVTEPTELSAEEASSYWADVLAVARGLIACYRPLKMNYETLGNSLPHLHTHLIPRYRTDPAPGRPFPLPPGPSTLPDHEVEHQAARLRAHFTRHPDGARLT
ncbi:HIT family protein [Yinghuangia sp. YIM S09857]|uniref:HIT family protein n=1 Tax=Yinghuangia sp. YIM S09857 TaxID=3436929 RepID=UPI003F5379DB